MAVNQAEQDAMQANMARFRIVSCGFRILRISASQVECATAGSTTSITNNFSQVPTLMLFKDVDNDMCEFTTIAAAASALPAARTPIIARPGVANQGGSLNDPIQSFPSSFAVGLLPQVDFLYVLAPASPAPSVHDIELLNGGHIEFLNSGAHYAYEWVNPDKTRWLTNFVQGTAAAGAPSDGTTIRPSWAVDVTSNLVQNVATEVTRNLTMIPTMHLLRAPPLFNDAGPITLNFEVWIEYHYSVEVIEGRYLNGRNTISALTTTILPANMVPYPQFSRMLNSNTDVNEIDPERRVSKRYSPYVNR